MSSRISYKFKNQRGWDHITFDKSYMTVLDVKRAIVLQKKLNQAGQGDFDLLLSNAQTGEVFREDGFLISRNTSLVVKRIPAAAAHTFRAGDSSDRLKITPASQLDLEGAAGDDQFGGGLYGSSAGADGSEASEDPEAMRDRAALQSLINKAQHESNQQNFASAAAGGGPGGYYGGGGSSGAGRSSGGGQAPMVGPGGQFPGAPAPGFPGRQAQFHSSAPHENYVCHRCGQHGHFIRNCPTNGDPQFDFKRAKPRTGIPRSSLTVVEDPQALGASEASTVVVADEGGALAVFRPSESAFARMMGQDPEAERLLQKDLQPAGFVRPGSAAGTGAGSSGDSAGTAGAGSLFLSRQQEQRILQSLAHQHFRAHMCCPVCQLPFRQAVTTPCCSSTYCDECLRQKIIEEGPGLAGGVAAGGSAVPGGEDEGVGPCCLALDLDQLKANARKQAMVDEALARLPAPEQLALRERRLDPASARAIQGWEQLVSQAGGGSSGGSSSGSAQQPAPAANITLPPPGFNPSQPAMHLPPPGMGAGMGMLPPGPHLPPPGAMHLPPPSIPGLPGAGGPPFLPPGQGFVPQGFPPMLPPGDTSASPAAAGSFGDDRSGGSEDKPKKKNHTPQQIVLPLPPMAAAGVSSAAPGAGAVPGSSTGTAGAAGKPRGLGFVPLGAPMPGATPAPFLPPPGPGFVFPPGAMGMPPGGVHMPPMFAPPGHGLMPPPQNPNPFPRGGAGPPPVSYSGFHDDLPPRRRRGGEGNSDRPEDGSTSSSYSSSSSSRRRSDRDRRRSRSSRRHSRSHSPSSGRSRSRSRDRDRDRGSSSSSSSSSSSRRHRGSRDHSHRSSRRSRSRSRSRSGSKTSRSSHHRSSRQRSRSASPRRSASRSPGARSRSTGRRHTRTAATAESGGRRRDGAPEETSGDAMKDDEPDRASAGSGSGSGSGVAAGNGHLHLPFGEDELDGFDDLAVPGGSAPAKAARRAPKESSPASSGSGSSSSSSSTSSSSSSRSRRGSRSDGRSRRGREDAASERAKEKDKEKDKDKEKEKEKERPRREDQDKDKNKDRHGSSHRGNHKQQQQPPQPKQSQKSANPGKDSKEAKDPAPGSPQPSPSAASSRRARRRERENNRRARAAEESNANNPRTVVDRDQGHGSNHAESPEQPRRRGGLIITVENDTRSSGSRNDDHSKSGDSGGQQNGSSRRRIVVIRRQG